MPVAAPEGQFVVELEEIGDPHGFPAANQASGNVSIVFVAQGLNKDPMAVEIDNVEGIEAPVVFGVPGAEEVGLMDVVASQRFPEIGVFDPFGLVRSYF